MSLTAEVIHREHELNERIRTLETECLQLRKRMLQMEVELQTALLRIRILQGGAR